jgi:hypothetical protein
LPPALTLSRLLLRLLPLFPFAIHLRLQLLIPLHRLSNLVNKGRNLPSQFVGEVFGFAKARLEFGVRRGVAVRGRRGRAGRGGAEGIVFSLKGAELVGLLVEALRARLSIRREEVEEKDSTYLPDLAQLPLNHLLPLLLLSMTPHSLRRIVVFPLERINPILKHRELVLVVGFDLVDSLSEGSIEVPLWEKGENQ